MGNFNLTDVVDNHGNHLGVGVLNTAYIRGTDQQQGFGTTDRRLFITSTALRQYVPTDYSNGDTLTLTWNFPDPGNMTNAALALATIDSQTGAAFHGEPGPPYNDNIGEGDSYPDISLSASALDWLIDNGFQVAPAVDAALLSAWAAHPPDSAPFASPGSNIGYVANGDFSLNVALAALVAAGSPVDPGCVFNAPQDLLVGNYNFAVHT